MKNIKQPSLLLGAHFSIAKGRHRAILEADSYKCNTLQIFTKNAQTWKEKTLTLHFAFQKLYPSYFVCIDS